MSLDSNKQIVREFFAHFGHKDVAGAMAMATDDATWWIAGRPELFPRCGTKTKAEITEALLRLTNGSRNGLSITPTGMVAEGDQVACEAESFAELLNGRTYNNQYHFLITLRNGKIAAVKEYLDTQHIVDVSRAP